MKIKLILLCLACVFMSINIFARIQNDKNYLAKPIGRYQVGFENVSWVDNKICSNDKHDNDCHKISVRIYYPTKATFHLKHFITQHI